MIANLPRLFLLVSGAGLLHQTNAFLSAAVTRTTFARTTQLHQSSKVATDKPTGTSFLPTETLERAEQGSPVEKVKLAKDGTAAFVDVYEYARKIRAGEMTWEDLDKADLESVRNI
jgi:hypothetical protein